MTSIGRTQEDSERGQLGDPFVLLVVVALIILLILALTNHL